MFCLEGMARSKPVICYLRDDLIELYENANIIDSTEYPHINTNYKTIKSTIRSLCDMKRSDLNAIGKKSKEFAEKYHSYDFIGSAFNEICIKLGILPSKPDLYNQKN